MKEIIKRYNDGREIWYDEAGHIIRIKHKNGTEDIRKYNDKGICIYSKFANGNICEYNNNGNLIYKKTKNTEETWEYDEAGIKCICHILKEYFS